VSGSQPEEDMAERLARAKSWLAAELTAAWDAAVQRGVPPSVLRQVVDERSRAILGGEDLADPEGERTHLGGVAEDH
jgi:hypothetical protein